MSDECSTSVAAPSSHHWCYKNHLVRRLKVLHPPGGETDISPVVAQKKRPASTSVAAPRILSRNGNIDDESMPDHVDLPHEETDDSFVNRLVDSESESEDERFR